MEQSPKYTAEGNEENTVCDLLFVFKTRRKLCLGKGTQETGDTGCLAGGEVDDREHGWDKGLPHISFYIVNFET